MKNNKVFWWSVALLALVLIVLGLLVKQVTDLNRSLVTSNEDLTTKVNQLQSELGGGAAPAASSGPEAAAASSSPASVNPPSGGQSVPAQPAAVSFVSHDTSPLTLGNNDFLDWQAPASVQTVYISATDGVTVYPIAAVPNAEAQEVAPIDGMVHGGYSWSIGSTQDGTALSPGDGYYIQISSQGFSAKPDDTIGPLSLVD